MKSFVFGIVGYFTIYFTTFYFVEKYVENLPTEASAAIGIGLLLANIVGMIEQGLKK